MSLALWQLLDSAFPAGAYTRSGGLEAAVQMEGLQAADLRPFMEQALAQAAGCALPLLNAAWDEPDRLGEWEDWAEASLPNAVARQASQAQGRALREAVKEAFGVAPPAKASHLAPLTGAFMRLLGCSREDARRAYLFWVLRDTASAAVRLGLVGAYAAQRLQQSLAPCLEQELARSQAWGPEDLAQQAPLMDLWQAGHARLERRLFQS